MSHITVRFHRILGSSPDKLALSQVNSNAMGHVSRIVPCSALILTKLKLPAEARFVRASLTRPRGRLSLLCPRKAAAMRLQTALSTLSETPVPQARKAKIGIPYRVKNGPRCCACCPCGGGHAFVRRLVGGVQRPRGFAMRTETPVSVHGCVELVAGSEVHRMHGRHPLGNLSMVEQLAHSREIEG